MDILGPEKSRSTGFRIAPLVCSILLHLGAIAVTIIIPVIGRSTVGFESVMDITLFDLPPGDILPGETTGQPSEDRRNDANLMDPSDAEIKRMKRRSPQEWTPPPRQTDGSEFEMRSGTPGTGTGKTTGSLALDSRNFPYIYYLSMLKNKISENWIPAMASGTQAEEKRVVIKFLILRNGQVYEPMIEESSGDESLDQSALRAVIVSSPFPQLPESYPESSLGVHFGFRFQM
ncbi:TonB C-terminal domain-containing protein [bacterium]|nr:TonB C-terminal domain-containing protein [candidate division CSSED10-310 bacterium]